MPLSSPIPKASLGLFSGQKLVSEECEPWEIQGLLKSVNSNTFLLAEANLKASSDSSSGEMNYLLMGRLKSQITKGMGTEGKENLGYFATDLP